MIIWQNNFFNPTDVVILPNPTGVAIILPFKIFAVMIVFSV